MMFSQTVEYALRAMMHLTTSRGRMVTSQSMACHIGVPAGYLSKVLRDLVVARLVTSHRGPNGGFALARGPNSITILDVVNAVEPIRRHRRSALNDDSDADVCALHQRVDDAVAGVEHAFRATLAEVVTSGRASPRRPRGAEPAPGTRPSGAPAETDREIRGPGVRDT